MSTYVAIVNALKTECGVSGATLTTLSNQVVEINRLAGWVNQAWVDIQEIHDDWFFLRQSFSFSTIAGQQSYTPTQAGIAVSPGLGVWKRDSMRIYSTSVGVSNEMMMPCIGYDQFRDLWQYGAMRTTQTRPTVFAIDPQFNLLLGAVPDAVYTVNGEYFQAPSTLSADSDVPVMPARWHNLIVYRAMQHYGLFEAAPEVLQRGQIEFSKMLSRLQAQQLPVMTFGASLC